MPWLRMQLVYASNFVMKPLWLVDCPPDEGGVVAVVVELEPMFATPGEAEGLAPQAAASKQVTMSASAGPASALRRRVSGCRLAASPCHGNFDGAIGSSR